MAKKTISIIGAGNGGQALAGYLALNGHSVRLYDPYINIAEALIDQPVQIELSGSVNGIATIDVFTKSIEKAVTGSEIILVATTADAHKEVAISLAPHLTDKQIVILNPGRTCGAIEFKNTLNNLISPAINVVVAEAQSLVFACRLESNFKVNIIGIKRKVLLAAYPKKDSEMVVNIMNDLFGCFEQADNVLVTSLENVGAMFHPAVVLFNAAAIERGNDFYFYNDITPTIADFLNEIDKERINIGKAFGIELIPIEEWVSYAYSDISGNNLYEKMKNNPAYYRILAPKIIDSRLLTEDIPTGLVPLSQLGDFVGVSTVLMKSMISITSALLKKNYLATGRTLSSMNLADKTVQEFLNEL